MIKTTYQKPEIRDANDNIIQQGAFGKNTALANSTNDGWIDYVANDLEFLYDLAKDEIVPVPSLPASGQMNKTYFLTTTGVSYRWSGTQWVAVSSSEAVGRAETAATNAQNYANAAQQSADDAQDTADDISEHLAQIDRNTGGISKNSKRIGNIEKLLQGNLYDYQTDETVAYEKTVPAGALPYAGVEKIGGKTVVMNQFVNSGTTSVATTSGHKYYTLIDGTASIVTSSGSAITIVDDTADMVCDLTLMFGAGNEPSTVEEFKAMFPADYYPYNAGTLLSAGVTSVVSNSTNIFDYDTYKSIMQSLSYPATRGTIAFSGNGFTVTATSDDAYTSYGGVLRIPIKPSVKYTLSVTVNKGGGSFWLFAYDSAGASTTNNHYNFANAGRYSITITSTSTSALLSYRFGVDTSRSSITFSNIQLEESETATEYKPYAFPSLSIPAEVQALEGYGWSAGTVYNYIDCERKVFVKRVGRVDLGTQNWVYSISQGMRFSSPVTSMALPIDSAGQIDGIICKSYIPSIVVISNPTGVDMAMARYKNGRIYIRNSAYTDETTFKAAMTGVYLYYELATPIETDISQYLTDNLIEVGAGGTLTFENSNGDDYHIPVPSTETYMINLQEAVSNG